jgi:Zn-dependent membrane protease YugP
MLQLRSNMVPLVNVSSQMSQWLIIIGLVLGAATHFGFGYIIAIVGLVLMGIATAFSFITLPVEYDASNRALAWLKNTHMLTSTEYEGAEDALKWAARTYVVAALGALANLLYWAIQLMGRRD